MEAEGPGVKVDLGGIAPAEADSIADNFFFTPCDKIYKADVDREPS